MPQCANLVILSQQTFSLTMPRLTLHMARAATPVGIIIIERPDWLFQTIRGAIDL